MPGPDATTQQLHPLLEAAGIRQRAEPVFITKESDPDAWHAERAGALGASEAAAALGLSPYMSPTELHLIKTGQLDPEDLSDKEAVYWGTVLEEPIAVRYAEVTGRTVINPHASFVHHQHPELRVNPDRFDIDPDTGEIGLVEVKIADMHLWDDWSDDGCPPWYQAQVGLQSYVTGIFRGRVACLLGGNRLLIREVDIDEELVTFLADRLLDWWSQHVVAGHRPPVDGSASCTGALEKLWKANGDRINLTADAMAAIVDYKAAHAQIKKLEDIKAEAGNRLRAILGPYSIGSWRNVDVVTWRSIETNRFDQTKHKEAHPDCHADHMATSTSRRLNVSDSAKAVALRKEAASA